jgi:hypothetical protein
LVGENRHELIDVGPDGLQLGVGILSAGLQLCHQRLGGGCALHGGEGIELGGCDGGFISGVIAEGLGQLLAKLCLAGLETGDHADDSIEQSSHGSERKEKETKKAEGHGTPRS